MSIKKQIIDDFKKAFKEKDQERKTVLSMLNSEIKNKEIELGLKSQEKDLPDEEVLKVIKKAKKQREDSIDTYKKGNRDDLVQAEQAELEIVLAYLPKELEDDVLELKVAEILQENDINSKQDFGKAMGVVMKALGANANGDKIRMFVEKNLN